MAVSAKEKADFVLEKKLELQQQFTKEVELASRIIGGEDAPVDRYGYMATLLLNGSFFCGGSLIAPNVVLSAAHCVELFPDAVLLGCVDIVDRSDCTLLGVEDHLIFPDYNALEISGDFGLLILNGSSSFDTIALAPPESSGFFLEIGTDLTTIGWGDTTDNPFSLITSRFLQEVGLEVTNFDNCLGRQSAFCAFLPTHSTCFGDSGGPIFLDFNGVFPDIQVGVTSFSTSFFCEGDPAGYAKNFF